jgi:hypothetical protein
MMIKDYRPRPFTLATARRDSVDSTHGSLTDMAKWCNW